MVMLYLSLGPGIFYIILGWMNDLLVPALIWYIALIFVSIWGYLLHKEFDYSLLGESELRLWYKKLSRFFQLKFTLWAVIFILYAHETQSNMHYIAIFTELGALVVAATLLFADRHTLRPILIILTLPLTLYFLFIGEFYAYVLVLFSLIFSWVLYYSSKSSYDLLEITDYQARHDQLTNLFNRRAFIDLLQRTTNELDQKKYYSYMLLIDLDHFKSVNDTFGHNIGDKLLIEVANRLIKMTKEGDVVSRIGGDEFVYLGATFSTHDDASQDAQERAHEMLSLLKESYLIDSHQIFISASIGISLLDQHSHDAHTFIKEADAAMYEVKSQGRDGAILFDEELSQKLQNHLAIEQRLHFALKNREIFLNFQPQFDAEKKIIGCEVLVRWISKELGFVSPDKFIPIAEQTGFMVPLGKYILEESVKILMDWYLKGIRLKKFSINISPRELFDHNFVEETIRICELHLDKQLCSTLVLEMTETHLVDDIARVTSIIEMLKERIGIGFSVDDFGTGYSSLSYIQKLPLDELKIDKSFVDEIQSKTKSQNMLDVIFTMADAFNLALVAEGVETQEQCDYLVSQKADIILQGYLLSKPLNQEEFETLYFKNRT